MLHKSIFSLLLLFISVISGESLDRKYTNLPYDIGDILPDSIHLNYNRIMCEHYAPYLNFILAHPATIDGIEYYYETYQRDLLSKNDESRFISAIIVEDSNFITPEGLSIGQPLMDALQYSNGAIVKMCNSYKVYVKLPSGWNTGNRLGSTPCGNEDYLTCERDTIPIERKRIEYFFKILYPDEYEEYENNYMTIIEGY